MDKGRVAEEGTHPALIERGGSMLAFGAIRAAVFSARKLAGCVRMEVAIEHSGHYC